MSVYKVLFGLIVSILFVVGSPSSLAATKVGILLYPNVQIIDFSGPYEVFQAADYDVKTVSVDGTALTTTGGLTVAPNFSFASAPDFDVLVIPGGDSDMPASDPVVIQWVRNKAIRSPQVLSVCTGAFILANTKLLSGRQTTTFKPALDEFQKLHPEIKVLRDRRFVVDGKFTTSSGLSTGIDAALDIVSRLDGNAKAKSVASFLEYSWPN